MHINTSSPIVTNCNFIGNTASQGGGIYNYFSSPVIKNVVLNGSMLPKVAEFIITHHCRLLPIVVLQETWLGLVAEELETVVIPHQP